MLKLLSDCILLGSTLRPQAFGKSFDGRGTCAYGSAQEALGAKFVDGKPRGYVLDMAPVHIWPWLDMEMNCPACRASHDDCNGQPLKALSIISNHLNDRHHWTRERIAGWVKTVEPELPAIIASEQSDELRSEVCCEQ